MSLWVFGYGSLLWDPGFEPAESRRGVLHGYHRSFCMLSIHYRGTEAQPGLVLALDNADHATCTGLALRAKDGQEDQVLADLRARELISDAYLEKFVDVETEAGPINAVTYVINHNNHQYCDFDLEKQAQMIASATGARGANSEYLKNTADHLDKMNIRDDEMAWLVQRVSQLLDPDGPPA